ncbi:MAG TPA: nuclear transport factor 2 family protein [Flavipsychrobacter sp.]|nr:nuclear transport factor 2 family protein [Flavipsychrobacter sp.]
MQALELFAQKETVDGEVASVKSEKQEATLLMETIQRFDNALMQRNVEELNRLVADKLKMVHSNGMVETKATLLGNIQSKKLVYESIEQGKNYEVQLQGKNKAVVQRSLDVRGILESKEFSVKLNTREEWILEENNWKLVKRESKNRE